MSDVIVVEGVHDEIKIKSVYPDAFCVITNGSEISEETLKYIKELSKTHNIIIFTDPDSPGERIRAKVLEIVPNAKNAFIRKKDSISHNKKKVGVEHADKEIIRASLEDVYIHNGVEKGDLTIHDLYSLGLNGDENSKVIRDKISDKLNIGTPNAKQFLKRCNAIGINYERLEELICEVK